VSRPVILHVDDDDDDAFFVKRAIDSSGLAVDIAHAGGGHQAIDYLQKHDAPALMLLDLKMPGMDGFDVLEWLRTRNYAFPVIVLSTSGLLPDHEQATRLGAQVVFVKSSNYRDLLREVAGRLQSTAAQAA
jgi:CheY-like chemotaxis protein